MPIPMDSEDEKRMDIEQQMKNATAVRCDFIVGSVTEADSGEVFVTLIPEKDGLISNVFFVIELALALDISEGLKKMVDDISKAQVKQ